MMFDPRTLPPAKFEGFDDYPHFGDPNDPCFGCNSRKLLVRPTLVTPRLLLVPSVTVADGFRVITGSWGLYPREHITYFGRMPSDWTACQQEAVEALGLTEADTFFVSQNHGKGAGKTAAHCHDWICLRGEGEEGLLCENLGAVTTMLRIKERGIRA